MLGLAGMMRPMLAVTVTVWLACAPAFGVMRAVCPRPSPGARLVFERQGARYVARGNDYQLSVSAAEAVLTYFEGFGDVDHWFREEKFRVQLVGASFSNDPPPAVRGLEGVTFRQVYPKIDLECGGTPQRIEYRFVAGAGADSSSIRIRLGGAGRIRVDDDGSVTARTPLGEIRIHAPVRDKRFDGERRGVEGRFVRRGKGLVEFRPRVN